ncbi:MAG TPA: redoxin family protein [Bryobacteraceae bacterium]|nr:redoxin family protein [Bryobacteraceae bacterium]
MRSYLLFAITVLLTAFTLLEDASGAAALPVVTTEPACPEWIMPATGRPIAPHINVSYNARAQGARLTSAQSMTLVTAVPTGPFGSRFESTMIPMTPSTNGIWHADYSSDRTFFTGYLIFFFVDERGRVDNNHAHYWDVLFCQDAEPTASAVIAQASTYEGRLLVPGIQRPPDLVRALDILKADLKDRPNHYDPSNLIWQYELQLAGGSDSAYEQVGRDLEVYIITHSHSVNALYTAVLFVSPEQQKLPLRVIKQLRNAVEALPQTADLYQQDRTGHIYPVSREVPPSGLRGQANDTAIVEFLAEVRRRAMNMLADLDYWSISRQQSTLQKKAEDYLAFTVKYPESLRLREAYGGAFDCYRALKDVAATEVAFEKLAALNPISPFSLLSMAEFYIAQKIKPERTLQLADQVAAIYAESQLPSSRQRISMQPGRLDLVRGQAHLMLNNLPAARADFEAAAKAAPGRPDVFSLLGQVCEQMGDNPAALEAYLSAAAAPYQESPAPREAYERLFNTLKLGSKQDAGQKLSARAAQNAKRVADAYTPLALTRPAPEFSYTDLAGKRFDKHTTKGKPALLTFWSIWCAPCVAELPAIEAFQKRHPEATLLAVEIGHKAEDVRSFLSAHNLRTLHVGLSADWPRDFGLNAVPISIVIDRFGQIQFAHVGQLADFGAILGKDLDVLPKPN